MPRVTPQTVQPVDQYCLEAAIPRVREEATPLRPLFHRQGAGNAVIGVVVVNRDIVESTVALGEVMLCVNRLALALLLGGDPEIDEAWS